MLDVSCSSSGNHKKQPKYDNNALQTNIYSSFGERVKKTEDSPIKQRICWSTYLRLGAGECGKMALFTYAWKYDN